MQTVTIPFSKKKLARTCGLSFDTTTRKWNIPDDLDAEVADFFRNLAEMEECEDYTEDEFEMVVPEENYKPNREFICEDSNNWKLILETDDTLQAAMAIRDLGLPANEDDRTELLTILGKRRQGDYAISYDSLCGCSDIFKTTYPIQMITRLIKENVTAKNHYAEEIRTSMRLSPEEKALLMFVLPV